MEVFIGNDVQLRLHVKIACYINPPNPGQQKSKGFLLKFFHKNASINSHYPPITCTESVTETKRKQWKRNFIVEKEPESEMVDFP